VVTFTKETNYEKGDINYWLPKDFSFTNAMGELPVLFLAFGY